MSSTNRIVLALLHNYFATRTKHNSLQPSQIMLYWKLTCYHKQASQRFSGE